MFTNRRESFLVQSKMVRSGPCIVSQERKREKREKREKRAERSHTRSHVAPTCGPILCIRSYFDAQFRKLLSDHAGFGGDSYKYGVIARHLISKYRRGGFWRFHVRSNKLRASKLPAESLQSSNLLAHPLAVLSAGGLPADDVFGRPAVVLLSPWATSVAWTWA